MIKTNEKNIYVKKKLFNGDGFAKQVSGFGDPSKWEEVTEEFKAQWEAEHPVEVENN